MITKRIAIAYIFLFLFAFTFALSFTLASKARAQQDCCVYQWCPDPRFPGIMGHLVYLPGHGHMCIYDGSHPCDAVNECPY
ncbi:MAG: hypothetical protein NTW07_07065 [candidate division Zixibacteria bacterium]|nr:hypothetical protein [candidate division Zixibacteria bacterium]